MANIQERIFEFIYGCALVDATKRVYPQGRGEEEIRRLTEFSNYKHVDAKDLMKNRLTRGAIDIVKSFTARVLDGEFIRNSGSKSDEELQQRYDKEMLAVAKRIQDEAIPEFTLGNAQKLINMTLKYVYTRIYDPTVEGERPPVADRFRYCHCPIDTRIAKKLFELKFASEKPNWFRTEGDGFAIDMRKINRDKKNDREWQSTWRRVIDIARSSKHPWSKMEFDDKKLYLFIQREIKKIREGDPAKHGVNSIEFDYFNW